MYGAAKRLCAAYRVKPAISIARRFLVDGKATTEGTTDFVKSSGLQLFHTFAKSNLLLTPIIHGPPASVINGPDNDSNVAIIQAILHNKSNAVYVYKHYTRGAWYSAQVATLVEHGIPREGIIAIADLGFAANREVLAQRLLEACKYSNLANIDMVVIRANEFHCNQDEDAPGPDILNESIDFLESTCAKNVISCYGIQMDVSPYNLHTPAFEKVDPYYECSDTVPMLEVFMCRPDSQMKKCDAVLYETSPSNAFPASYSMLRANDEDIAKNPEVFSEETLEDTRTHTRIAINPLTCYEGWGDAPLAQDNVKARKQNKFDEYGMATCYDSAMFLLYSQVHSELVCAKAREHLDILCPKLGSTTLLEDKALRLIFSIGYEVCVLDSDLSAAVGRLRLTLKDMLSAKDAENVFGVFQITPELYDEVFDESAAGGAVDTSIASKQSTKKDKTSLWKIGANGKFKSNLSTTNFPKKLNGQRRI